MVATICTTYLGEIDEQATDRGEHNDTNHQERHVLRPKLNVHIDAHVVDEKL